ncbi:MAG: hypothetical protein ACRD2E_11635 [Terriglobales bacterium]
MRWLLIGLGIVTFLLALVLAKETQWWIAVPDGCFGVGIAWIAWEDLHAPAAGAPAARTISATPEPASVPAAMPAGLSQPAPVAKPAAPKARPSVPSAKKRRKNRR